MTEIRQIALLPAGCQPWNRSVVAMKGRRFAYGATLAIYIYEMDNKTHNFYLHSIMSEHKKVITALDWHPRDIDLLASASIDPCICIWNIAHHSLITLLNTSPTIPSIISWLPGHGNVLVYLEHKGPLYCWKFRNYDGNIQTESIYNMKEYPPFNNKITCLALCKSEKLNMAFGHEDGTVSIYAKDKKPQRHINIQSQGNEQEKSNDESSSITSLQWDPLSSHYILVACGCNYLYLLDTSNEVVNVVSTYSSPSKAVSIASIAWLPEVPGSFVSADVDVGILRIWNVSKCTPLENRRLKQTGFLTFCVLPAKKPNKMIKTSDNSHFGDIVSSGSKFLARIICLFLDGGVGVYDLSRYSWDFCREMGHTETIFDCEFKPSNCDLLATASYDGTIKVWNVNTMKAIDSSPGNMSIIYSISWAPGDLNSIVAGTSNQGIIIWNLEKNVIAHKMLSHGKNTNVYSVSWNQRDARKIASGGADKCCMVHQSDGCLLFTFKHPSPVYGCDWNISNENILVTSCEDKNIRIFYVSSNNSSPLKILPGHTAKVFRVKWAPLKEGVFCSGSDDCTIRIWDYASGESLRTLTGHKHNVRGLQWHSELANILLSGSWDFTIRVWDISDGTCLNIMEDHGGDVYGLSCHPKRPFLLASTSRDSTVRLWSLFSLASTIYLKILVHRPWDEIFRHLEKSEDFPIELLCGQASKQLKSNYKFQKKQYKKAIKMFSKLLCPSLGVSNIWDLVLVLQDKDTNELSETYGKGIIHHKQLLKYRSSEAQETELIKMTQFGTGGIGVPTREECLRNAAKKHLLTGNLKRYCELKIDLGEWKDALAVAPGVSLNYWTSVATRWAKKLLTEGNGEAIPALLATGNGTDALEFYRSQGELQQAYCIAAAISEGVVIKKETNDSNSYINSPGNDYNKNYVKEVLEEMSEQYFNQGSPIYSACCHLAADDVRSALTTLIQGNELELAVSLAITFEEYGAMMKTAVTHLAWRCVKNRNWELAMDLLNLSPDTDLIKAQICIFCELSLPERNELYQKANLPLMESCLSEATVAENNNVSILEVVKLFLLSEKPAMGLELGLSFIREKLSVAHWKLNEVWDMLQLLAATRMHVLHDSINEIHCSELLLYSSYIGGIMAMCHGYYPIVGSLISVAIELLDKVQLSNLPFDKELLVSELAVWKLHRSELKNYCPEKPDVYNNLMCRINEKKILDVGVTKVTGSHLPRHSDQHKCYLTKQPLQGPVFFLEKGKLAISLNDAIMWAKVNPFSPLNDGQRIIPF
ncbi:WD repeat-containing protein 17-like [Centruroides vittatus]|uniref:WD repeat-containing protein 17-like n=1 Tax=Centruroides vittatus TaxID=120091 RepID=UPI00350E9F99